MDAQKDQTGLIGGVLAHRDLLTSQLTVLTQHGSLKDSEDLWNRSGDGNIKLMVCSRSVLASSQFWS